jgi:hypothetical protein
MGNISLQKSCHYVPLVKATASPSRLYIKKLTFTVGATTFYLRIHYDNFSADSIRAYVFWQFLCITYALTLPWIKSIKLLQLQRCTRLLHKIIPILECLTTYHLVVIGNPNWPSTNNNNSNTSALFLKAYFNNIYIDTSDIVQFLDLTTNEILLIGYKYLLKINSQDKAHAFEQSLQLSDIDTTNELHQQLVCKTLIQLDQIFRCSTVDLWIQY